VDEGACAPPHDAREGEVFVPLAAGFALANPGGEMVLGPEAEAVARGGGGVEGLLHGATGNVIGAAAVGEAHHAERDGVEQAGVVSVRAELAFKPGALAAGEDGGQVGGR